MIHLIIVNFLRSLNLVKWFSDFELRIFRKKGIFRLRWWTQAKTCNGKVHQFAYLQYKISWFPENLLSNDGLIFDEGNSKGMPAWFKTTIQWWVDGEISDDEFKRTVDFLRDEGLLRPR